MVLVPVLLLEFIWLAANIIWLNADTSGWGLLRFFLRLTIIVISLASLYPFIKLIFPILTESEEDFLPSTYNVIFFLIIILYCILLIIYPPFFIPFFVVFIVFSGFASIIELQRGINEKNLLRIIIPAFNLFGKLYFVYLFPAIIQTYTFISYLLIIVDFILWFIFLRDHKLFYRVRALYKNIERYMYERKFKKTFALILMIFLIFYLFSWPIYTEFWQYLIVISPDAILVTITGGSLEESKQYELISYWFPIIGLVAFITGIICAFIYLLLSKYQK